MNMQKIKNRNEINIEETWDLSDLFQDFDIWEKNFKSLPSEEEVENIIQEKFKNKLAIKPDILFECLQYKENLSRKLENLFVYAQLRSTEDTSNNRATEAVGKIENKMANLTAKFSFMNPEMLEISNLKIWLEKSPLNAYKFSLSELLRSKEHILTEKEEEILAKLSVPLRTFDEIHSKWNNADLKFEPALDSVGDKHIVSNSRYSLNLQSRDRKLRENTFQSYYQEIAKWRNTITANYYGNMSTGSNIAKIRKFSGFLESELFDDNIPIELYDSLIKNVKANLKTLHESMRIRKKILKLEKVYPYDRYVSLFESKENAYFSWEEGRDLVLKAIQPLGNEYVEIATRGLTKERWIDRAENEGKRSGAFSWGTYDSRPYMLQTWTGTLGDVYTLAHELGHSMHSYYSNKNQPYHNAHYAIFVAEVASTLNEALLSQYILKERKGTDLAKYVLSENVENFEGTVLRQVLFANFEREAAKIVDENEAFTPEKLEEIYFNMNKEWYGEEHSALPDFIKHEWMRIPHFYSAFYVYKYATSYCASLALSEALQTDPETTRKQIFTLLKAGGSKPPLEILLDAGIDFLTPKPVENAFLNYQKNLAIAENEL
ncbi:oligoendopeptidase F [Pigmentibacter sp. JX0631]|uniref:oligoendopeptidase F n=1 Tax=Pigmentibacter sp. JX0631 TaxID=2976982 RepID=UPI0024686E4A|nr:oligoendopeptidase F [Pigmentibacter sp. JX0631]WGL60255.1 oligoendopeptidase F [Pigmentibacter sp. JX0631]